MLCAYDINSNRTGWAFGGPADGAPRCGVWKLPGGEDLPRACAALYNSVSELSKLLHPKIVVIEAPLTMINSEHGARPALVLMALYGAACAAGNNAGARVIPANVSTWRKHFIGHGGLSGDEAKRQTLARCKLLRWNAENHDEGDACGVWSWGMATNYPRWSPKSTPLFREVAA